jgi:hypothetical protein
MKSRKPTLSLLAGILLITSSAGTLQGQETPPAEDEPVNPSAVNHDIAGKEACLVCHAIGASPILDVPADHENRANETCMWCHATDSPMLTAQPSKTPHRRATAETGCMRCHGPEANPEVVAVPATHEGRGNETCMWCHVKVKGEGGRG